MIHFISKAIHFRCYLSLLLGFGCWVSAPLTALAEGRRLVEAPDGHQYLIENGEKRAIKDERWLRDNGFAGQTPQRVSFQELASLRMGSDLLYQSRGRNALILTLTPLCAALLLWATRQKNRHWGSAWRLLGLAFFAAAVLLRQPPLVQQPRFWAEEGRIFFAYALHHPIGQTLLFVPVPEPGYFNLGMNGAAALAARVAQAAGLEYAPTVTTWLAFVVQTAVLAAILLIPSSLFKTRTEAMIGCAVVLFAPTTIDEVWLNMTNALVFFGLLVLVLLFAEPGRFERWPVWMALALSGLSSPYAAALTPAYWWRAWRTRQREHRISAFILTACLLVQVGCVIATQRATERERLRTYRGKNVSLSALPVAMFWEHLVRPTCGNVAVEWLLERTASKEAAVAASSPPPRPYADRLPTAAVFCAAGTALALWLWAGRSLYSERNLLVLSFVSLSAFVCLTAVNSIAQNRYAVLPGICLLFLIAANISCAPQWRRGGAALTLSLALVTGFLRYRTVELQTGPPWKMEVQAWRKDPSYSPKVWPHGAGGAINLKEAGAWPAEGR